MRILFDQATPVPIRPFLEGHIVSTAAHEGWDRLQNGELLDAAEAAGFDVLVTTDKNMRYQQNLAGGKIAIIALSKQQWPEVRPHVQLIVAAVNAAKPGTYVEVEIPKNI
jgi:predicted nuclease of predicted toxin-antitoxin system